MKRSLSTALFSLFFEMGCNEPGKPPRISSQVRGTFVRCENSAPFITDLIIGKPTAQGYPVEIKGLACVSDGNATLRVMFEQIGDALVQAVEG